MYNSDDSGSSVFNFSLATLERCNHLQIDIQRYSVLDNPEGMFKNLRELYKELVHAVRKNDEIINAFNELNITREETLKERLERLHNFHFLLIKSLHESNIWFRKSDISYGVSKVKERYDIK